MALKVKGTAGRQEWTLQSGIEVAILSQEIFKINDLCSSITKVAQRMSSTSIDPTSVHAPLAYQLIALDKSPGVRLIGFVRSSRGLYFMSCHQTCSNWLAEASYALVRPVDAKPECT